MDAQDKVKLVNAEGQKIVMRWCLTRRGVSIHVPLVVAAGMSLCG
jgi:hypothetical protein